MKNISSQYPFDISLKNVDIDVLLLERKYSIFEMQDSLESIKERNEDV